MNMRAKIAGLLVGGAAVSFSGDASAHVSLMTKTARADAQFDAVFNVGHGCSGSPTVKLRIQIPEGVVDIITQNKEGWAVSQETHQFDHPVTSSGQTYSNGAKEVTWSGMLSAHKPDSFSFRARLSKTATPGQKILFPVIQQCEKGEERWIDQDDSDDHPAPALTVVP